MPATISRKCVIEKKCEKATGDVDDITLSDIVKGFRKQIDPRQVYLSSHSYVAVSYIVLS